MITTNKFQYFGVYKTKDNLKALCFYKVVDIVTTFITHREFGQECVEYASFYTCDYDGVYISPRAWGILEEDCLCQPFIYPLKEFLEIYEKI